MINLYIIKNVWKSSQDVFHVVHMLISMWIFILCTDVKTISISLKISIYFGVTKVYDLFNNCGWSRPRIRSYKNLIVCCGEFTYTRMRVYCY